MNIPPDRSALAREARDDAVIDYCREHKIEPPACPEDFREIVDMAVEAAQDRETERLHDLWFRSTR